MVRELDEDVIELGAASAETHGSGPQPSDEALGQVFGLSDD
ncbi:hypothetical protein EDF58_11810 [Novosphingobium sp. PhB57]|jgi:hypothetical protein|nr:benenodin family lasso peptide [Novosphingobium sp. PhB57]TCU51837.1 hypothetical protein EDF58_11810 [Novosphingobium sp. PhB57]